MKMRALAGIMAAVFMLALLVPAFGQTEVDLIADGPDYSFNLDIGHVTVTEVTDLDGDPDVDALDIAIFIDNPVTYDYILPDGTTTSITTYWYLNETHVHLVASADSCNPADFPSTSKGNPKVGKFAFAESYVDLGPGAQTSGTYTWLLPFDGWTGTVCIAAQAVVSEWDQDNTQIDYDGDLVDDPTRYETAWGDGTSFPGSNWAMWFEHEVVEVV